MMKRDEKNMVKTSDATSPRPVLQSKPVVVVTQDVPDAVTQALTAAQARVIPLADHCLEDLLAVAQRPVGLVWDIPARAVAAALLSGAAAGDALADWLARHRDLLPLLRRNRRHLRLVDARLLHPGGAEADQARLADWLELPAMPTPHGTGPTDLVTLASLLAAPTIARIADLRACLDELEASSLTATAAPASLAIADAAFPGIDQLRHLIRDPRNCRQPNAPEADGPPHSADRAREIALLRDQLDLQREEMIRKAQEDARQQERRTRLDHEAERSLARALADLRDEARERQALQERLEQAEARLREMQEERDRLGHTLDAVYRSRSWRITAPLRRHRAPTAAAPDGHGT